jgi:hypothetical protein
MMRKPYDLHLNDTIVKIDLFDFNSNPSFFFMIENKVSLIQQSFSSHYNFLFVIILPKKINLHADTTEIPLNPNYPNCRSIWM